MGDGQNREELQTEQVFQHVRWQSWNRKEEIHRQKRVLRVVAPRILTISQGKKLTARRKERAGASMSL